MQGLDRAYGARDFVIRRILSEKKMTENDPSDIEENQQAECWDFWQARMYGKLIGQGAKEEGASHDAWDLRRTLIEAGWHWVKKIDPTTSDNK